MVWRGASARRRRFQLLKVKKMKKAKSSERLVDEEMWSKKQKWSYDPEKRFSAPDADEGYAGLRRE